jgi:hypothetical protein
MFVSKSSKVGGVEALLSCPDDSKSFISSHCASICAITVASSVSLSSFECSAPTDDLVVEIFLLGVVLSIALLSSIEAEFLVNALLAFDDSKYIF